MADLKLTAEFGANTKELEKAVKRVEGRLAGLERSNKQAGDSAQALAKKTAQSKAALKQFGVIAAGAAIAIGIDSVRAFAKFQKGMAEVGTLTKFTEKQMHSMSLETKKMSQQFGQSLETLTKARYDIVSAGFSDITEQTLLLTQANKLAIGGVTDVSTATDALTSVINAYGKEIISAEKASDILFATVQGGKTTIPELSNAIGKVLPTAKAAGVSFEEVGASIATLTSIGISTPQAVTALNSAIFALSAPTKEAAKNLDEMGIKTTDATGAMLPMQEVLGQFEGMSLEQIRDVIPDKEAAKAILAAANNMGVFGEKLDLVANSAGVSDQVFGQMSKTAAFQFAQAEASLNVLKTTFGEFIADGRSGLNVVGALNVVMNDWNNLLTLDEKGVSNLRREWELMWDERNGKRAQDQIAAVAGLMKAEERLADTVTKLNDDQLEAFIRNRSAANEKVVSDDEKTAERISRIYDKLALEQSGSFAEAAADIVIQSENMWSSISSAVSAVAPSIPAPVAASFNAVAGDTISGFENVASTMLSTAGGMSGIFGPVSSSMSSEASSALATFNAMVAQARANANITIRVNTVQGSAEGGMIYGFARGGLAPSDTVPAMLTPGEMVINKEQTAKHQGILQAINSGVGGFAKGGLVGVQGFAGGGLASAVGVGGMPAGGTLSGLDTSNIIDIEAIEEANEAMREAQLEANEKFIEMMNDFQDDITEIQLEKMDEREQLFFERQQTLSDILQGPFSEEQKELLVENANAFYDAQLQAMEEAEIAEREKEQMDLRLKNYEFFFSQASRGFDRFFSGVISGEEKFGVALGNAFKQQGSQLIDFAVSKLITEQMVEQFIAMVQAPNTMGASLAKIPLILAAAGAGKAALGAIKFHEGGIVGGDINSPPRDVPATLQTGEAVLSRDTVQEMASGGGQPMEIINIIELDGDELARRVVSVPAKSRFI